MNFFESIWIKTFIWCNIGDGGTLTSKCWDVRKGKRDYRTADSTYKILLAILFNKIPEYFFMLSPNIFAVIS
jgi:hypothetical protein